MPDYTVSADVDSMLRSANNDAIRSAIGVGTTDTTTFARLSLNSAVSYLYFKSATGVERGFFYTDSGGSINYRFGLSGGQFVMQGATGVAATNNGLVWLSATELWTEGANVLAQRRGTNAQTLRIYNTTDGTNKEYLNMGWSANVLNIGASNEGTGVQRDIKLAANSVIIRPAGTDCWIFTNIGHLWAGADNAYDIGASGANRPRSIYVGQDVIAGAGYSFRFATAGGFGGSLSNFGNGIFGLLNAAQNGFGRLQLGGTTSAFPAIKRNGTGIDIRLADDSAFAPVKGKITTDTNYTAGVPSATGYLTIYDATGTAYRVPCTV